MPTKNSIYNNKNLNRGVCDFIIDDTINVIPCAGEEKGTFHNLFLTPEQIPGRILGSLNNMEFKLIKAKNCFNNPDKGIGNCNHEGSLIRYDWDNYKSPTYKYSSCNPNYVSVYEKCKNFWYIF